MSMGKEETPIFWSRVYPPASLDLSSYAALSVLLQSFIEEHCKNVLQGYIWQREAPRVTVTASEKDDLAHLVVSMRHGGNVEDEWLVVHLLMLASADRRFSESALLESLEGRREGKSAHHDLGEGGLAISAKDEDGQFLLIEGADHLPDWVQPDNADGRLWMYQGHFHLIPPEIHRGDGKVANISTQMDDAGMHSLHPSTALALVRSPDCNTRASAGFEEAILRQRLPSYPDLAWALLAQHSTLMYLPPKAARVLRQYPQILANAAEAFDGREGPNDARCLRAMKTFLPASVPNPNIGSTAHDALLVKIKLPRRLYATLLSQRYLPSKAFGEEWRQSVSRYWEVLEKVTRGEILTSDEEIERDEGRRRDLGAKIACGLELAYANVKERLKSRPSDLFSSGKDSEERDSPLYPPFIATLTRMGFFGDNIKDSQAWKSKEKQALEILRKSRVDSSELDDEHTSDDLDRLIDLAKDTKEDLPLPPHLPDSIPRHALALEEDPDGFLYDAPGQTLLPGDPTKQGNDDRADGEVEVEEEKAAMEQVNAFADKLQDFVEGKGDETGALFEDEDLDSDAESDDVEGEKINKSLEELTHEEKLEAMKGLVPDLPSEQWGAKRKDRPAKNADDEVDAMSVDGDVDESEERTNSHTKSGATGFSRRIRYDGASDSEESVDDEILRAGDTDEDRRNRAKWLDIEREVEEDEKSRKAAKEDLDAFDLAEQGEDGEEGLTFGQDELMNFIEFTRKELGLTSEQYEDILRERRERGAYVPTASSIEVKQPSASFTANKKVTFEDVSEVQPISDEDLLKGLGHKSAKQAQAEKKEEHEKALRNQRTTAEEKKTARDRAQRAMQEVEATINQQAASAQIEDEPSDPFEKLMRAMDDELAKHKGQKRNGINTNGVDSHMPESKDGGDSEEDEDEIMSAEDAELLEKMLYNGPPASLRALMEKQSKGGDEGELSSVEQEVMQSMLASYQAQMGGAGPVGALAGRLGVGALPRNTDK